MLDEPNAKTIRPVEPRDAVQLRENCFSANTLAEVEADIAARIQGFVQMVSIIAATPGGRLSAGNSAKSALCALASEMIS
jgi:hypothetical protein